MAKSYRFENEECFRKACKNKRFDEKRSSKAKEETISRRKNKRAEETLRLLSYKY